MSALKFWPNCVRLHSTHDWKPSPTGTAILSDDIPNDFIRPAGFDLFANEQNSIKISGRDRLRRLLVPDGTYWCNGGAFENMPHLKTVIFRGNVILCQESFEKCPQLKFIYVKGYCRIITDDRNDRTKEARINLGVRGGIYHNFDSTRYEPEQPFQVNIFRVFKPRLSSRANNDRLRTLTHAQRLAQIFSRCHPI